MKPSHKYIIRYFTAILLVLSTAVSVVKAQVAETDLFATEISWETERIDAGIYWNRYLGDVLFDSKQSLNLVEIYLDSTDARLQISYRQGELVTTSEFAELDDALIAVNGSYFDMEAGGTVTFLKVQGSVITEGFKERRLYSENGGIGWNSDLKPHIFARPHDGWAGSHFENVLAAGPLLILDSEIREFNNDSFNQNRHPRTAVAITEDNRLLLLTVDGRSFQSFGMTIPELAAFLKAEKAIDALNLDGGGSTSMWIKNKETEGLVNYPSDNLEFDHEGERGVSNALLILLD